MNEQVQTVLIAAGCTSAVGLMGLGALPLLRQAPLRLTLQVGNAVVILAIVAGTLGTAEANGPLVLRADPRELSRALVNLLIDAIQHTPVGGSVHVAATAEAGGVVLALIDDCGGIPRPTWAASSTWPRAAPRPLPGSTPVIGQRTSTSTASPFRPERASPVRAATF